MKYAYFIPGYIGVRFRAQSTTEAETKALQQTDPGGRHVDPVSVEMLRGRQEFQQPGDLEHLHQGAEQPQGQLQ